LVVLSYDGLAQGAPTPLLEIRHPLEGWFVLLHLDPVDAPRTWPRQTYDYFWIVDVADRTQIPTGFHKMRQVFKAPFDDLPSNRWDEPEPQHLKEGCRD
jgi:hypothetical protein